MENPNDTVTLTLSMSREELQNVQRAIVTLMIAYEAAPLVMQNQNEAPIYWICRHVLEPSLFECDSGRLEKI